VSKIRLYGYVHALLHRLVFPQPNKDRLAKHTVGRDVFEANFADKMGFNLVHIAVPLRVAGGAAFLARMSRAPRSI